MKKLFLLSIVSATITATTAFGQVVMDYQPDPVFKESQIKALRDACPSKPAVSPKKPRKILIFSRTSGFRHYHGIVAAKEVFKYMGDKLGTWETVISDDLAEITPENLKKYDAIILNNATAACFGPSNKQIQSMPREEAEQKIKESFKYCENIIEYVRNGGGVFGIHAAPDAYNYNNIRHWKYTNMLGGEFIGHPWNIGAKTNPKYTLAIDDPKSPVIKGIWESNGFMLQDEMYMMGKSYDRSKCRVIVRLVPELSYFITEKYRLNPLGIRKDGDIALVWIKSYGKGRVAYGGFGHADNNYPNPKIQELYMRLIQFVCGDLEADTSSVPMNKEKIFAPMCDAPTMEKLASLSAAEYGKDTDNVNDIIFGVASNSFNKKYCKQVENFVYGEISANKGTPFYRAMMAEMLWYTGFANNASATKFEKLAKKIDDKDGIQFRILNAIAHHKSKGEVPYAKEKAYKLPKELPQAFREQARLMKYLADNPSVKIPEYLKFDALDTRGKARLIYTLGERGDDLSEALKLTPDSEPLTIAVAYAASKAGSEKDIANILKGANGLTTGGIKNVASYIASIKSKAVANELLKLNSTATSAQSVLVGECLSRINLDDMVKEVFEGYAEKTPELRAAVMKTAATIANAEVFTSVAKIIPTETDKRAKAEAIKALLRAAQNSFKPEMFDSIEAAFEKSDATTKKMLLRLVRFASNDAAVRVCQNAYRAGLKTEAIKALGEFDSQLAMAPLMAIVKASKDERERTLAEIAIVDVASKCGFSDDAAKHILKQSLRQEEKDRAIEVVIKKPSPEAIKILRELGKDDEANKAEKTMSTKKITFYASEGDASSFAKKAMDNNRNTRWSSNAYIKNGSWLAMDFGYAKKISALLFDLASSQSDFPPKFKVQAGSTLTSTRDVDFGLMKSGGKIIIIFKSPISAQVIKVVSTVNHNMWWSVYEFEARGNFSKDSLPKVPVVKFMDTIVDFSSATDGNIYTRWSSNKSITNGMWLGVQLPEAKQITQLMFNIGTSTTDFPGYFKVQAGNDLSQTSDVPFTASRNGSVITVKFEKPIKASAVKIISTVKSGKWWSIHEFAIR